MTTISPPSTSLEPAAPLSRAAQLGAGACLVVAGLTNGLSQYVGEFLMPELDDFSAQIRWGADHVTVQLIEQTVLLVSMLVLPFGFLGLAHLTRWSAPRLTALGLILTLWGMWGFHNVVALGYSAGTVAPSAIGVDNAVELNDAYITHAGTVVTALLPHLLGSFFGLLLLAGAGLKGRSLPRVPLVLLIVFLVWDFLLPSFGPLEPHLLLAAALIWLGIHIARFSPEQWRNPTR